MDGSCGPSHPQCPWYVGLAKASSLAGLALIHDHTNQKRTAPFVRAFKGLPSPFLEEGLRFPKRMSSGPSHGGNGLQSEANQTVLKIQTQKIILKLLQAS